MKSFIQIILVVFILSSCNKTLEENPRSIAAETFYNTPSEVEAGVNAIYGPLKDGGALGALYLVQLEIYGEYIYGRGSHAPLNEYTGLDNTNISRVTGAWQLFYRAIRNANIIIKNAPHGSGMTAADISKYVGEARYMRALTYFHLVRNWAGVPIRDENNMDSIDVQRSTSAEVYQFIVDDLLYAESNLPDNARISGAPSKWAAKTVLADVYMNMSKYAEARTKSFEVIQGNKFSLVTVAVSEDFEKIFGADVATTPEEIFYLKFSRQGGTLGFGYVMYAHYPGSGYFPPGGFYTDYSDTTLNPAIKGWDRQDLRFNFNWYYRTFGLGNATILNKKFKDVQAANANNAGNDYPMYRYADVLLMYAECDNRVNNGPTADALEKLNMVHRRAYGKSATIPNALVDLKMSDLSTAQLFLNAVVKERLYETCYEGKRWFDLKRLGIAKQVILAVKGKTVAEKFMLWPIPSIEYNYNKAIDPVKDQNPGY